MTEETGVGRTVRLAAGITLFSMMLGGSAVSQQLVRVESVVTVRYSSEREAFRGRVSSSEQRCVRRRVVLLKKARRDRPDQALSRDVTNRRGRYHIGGFRNPRGRFYTVAKRKEITPPGVVNPTIICTRSRSATIRPS
ncbi:MAG: hypothetical protein M3N53_07890 [Actinomycetota bacterium]|nr:hypothetical protein [Actinomycetota bacterium]